MLWFLTFIRGILVAVYVGVVTIFFSVVTIVLSSLFGAPDLAFQINRMVWAKPIMFLAGIQVEYRAEPGVPSHGFLYLFNHTSYNDIISMIAGLPKPPMFGAKAELFKIPFFGPAMRSIGILPIHRDKREKVLKVYRDAKVRVQKGEQFALAPEGTRQEGDSLGKFKKGPFLFAIHSEMPVVPLLIVGARQTQPKGQYLMNVGAWKRKIVIKALSPVDGSRYHEGSLDEFQLAVRDKMQPAYEEIKTELGIGS